MMPLYGLVWSLCTIGTAAATTYDGLWWSRLVFGMAQGGLIPCLTRACLDWFPEDRRGTASAPTRPQVATQRCGRLPPTRFRTEPIFCAPR